MKAPTAWLVQRMSCTSIEGQPKGAAGPLSRPVLIGDEELLDMRVERHPAFTKQQRIRITISYVGKPDTEEPRDSGPR